MVHLSIDEYRCTYHSVDTLYTVRVHAVYRLYMYHNVSIGYGRTVSRLNDQLYQLRKNNVYNDQ